jgi:hypothetical protein
MDEKITNIKMINNFEIKPVEGKLSIPHMLYENAKFLT